MSINFVCNKSQVNYLFNVLMYTNDIKLQFKKTGKWEKRDGLWLDLRTSLDGELNDLACKKVSELIVSLLINNKFFITRPTYNTFIYNEFF